jgi:NitT/TauT family transport system permease protein
LGWYDARFLPPPHIFVPEFPEQAKSFDTARLIAGEQLAYSAFGAVLTTVGATTLRVIAGLTLGFAVGVGTGVAIRYFTYFGRLTIPSLTLLAPISPFAWLPVAIFVLGNGNVAAVFLVFIAVYFIIVIATVAEIDGVNPILLKAAWIMGANRRQTYLHVILPAVLPGLFVILRLNLFGAWMMVLVAESAGVGSGLGAVVMLARNTANPNLVFLGLVVIGLVGFLFDFALRQVQRRMLYWVSEEPVGIQK